jgi:sortase A
MGQHLRVVERALLLLGTGLLAVCAVAQFREEVLSRWALRQFKDDEIASMGGGSPANSGSSRGGKESGVDFGLWSVNRIAAYKKALLAKTERPLGILNIPRLDLEVPVFEGTDDLTLNRGAGRIIGTAKPGSSGNIGIAAHRDGFFRSLKDIQEGDEIDLVTAGRKAAYLVDSIKIVTPDDVTVLRARGHPSLTLVTCYPFYFVGSAPNRYIVQASLSYPKQTKAQDSTPQSITTKEEAHE